MINIIVAMTKQGVIGRDNALPWQIPDELKYFKQVTQDSVVIMGLHTFYSIGKPLPRRHNIVLGPSDISIPGAHVCQSIDEAMLRAHEVGKKIFVIGGAHTYRQFLPLAQRLYISYIKQNYDGDVLFPAVNWNEWSIVTQNDHQEFECFIYDRITATDQGFL